jgi:hypothetical protein
MPDDLDPLVAIRKGPPESLELLRVVGRHIALPNRHRHQVALVLADPHRTEDLSRLKPARRKEIPVTVPPRHVDLVQGDHHSHPLLPIEPAQDLHDPSGRLRIE